MAYEIRITDNAKSDLKALDAREIRVFYDVEAEAVTVLTIVPKSRATEGLHQHGVIEE